MSEPSTGSKQRPKLALFLLWLGMTTMFATIGQSRDAVPVAAVGAIVFTVGAIFALRWVSANPKWSGAQAWWLCSGIFIALVCLALLADVVLLLILLFWIVASGSSLF